MQIMPANLPRGRAERQAFSFGRRLRPHAAAESEAATRALASPSRPQRLGLGELAAAA
jgi:hypothetical protein